MGTAELELVREYIGAGYCVDAIAEYLGRSDSTIRRAIALLNLPYERRKGGQGRRQPRIVNGAVRVSEEVRERIVSAARREGTIAAAAKAGGVDWATAERVLEHDAPLVLRFRVRGGVPGVGDVLRRTLGDSTRLIEQLQRYDLMHQDDFDMLILDYGPDAIAELLAVVEQDLRALYAVRRMLRTAVALDELAFGDAA